jgi:hypothetical protein
VKVDDPAVTALTEAQRAANGVPAHGDDAHGRAVELVTCHLSGLLRTAVRTSPLGPAWSSDIDIHVTSVPSSRWLSEIGWLPLDRLLRRIGSRGRGRWLVMDGYDALACADISDSPAPEPVGAVLHRVRRRGEVRLREVLELSELARRGEPLPPDDPVVGLAARIEATYGGNELSAYLRGGPLMAPAPYWHGIRGQLRRVKRALPLHRRRYVVAISGDDEVRASALTVMLTTYLQRAGIPVDVADTSASIARGSRSTQGRLGWLSALSVVLSHVLAVRWRHRATRGVVIYNHHLVDALAALEDRYQAVDLRLHRELLRWLLPRARLSCHLDAAPHDAVRPTVAGMVVLDARRPLDHLAGELLELLTAR